MTNMIINIPILPEAFWTFASRSSIGPSYAFHVPYTPCTPHAISEDTFNQQLLLGANENCALFDSIQV